MQKALVPFSVGGIVGGGVVGADVGCGVGGGAGVGAGAGVGDGDGAGVGVGVGADPPPQPARMTARHGRATNIDARRVKALSIVLKLVQMRTKHSLRAIA